MRFNQCLPDPQHNRTIVRNVEVNIDDVRLAGEYSNQVRMFANCDGASCVIEPGSSYYKILDNKRTFRIPQAKQSKVIAMQENWIWIDNEIEFAAKIYEPVAVISEQGTQYGFIQECDKSKLIGMIIQNLSGIETRLGGSNGILSILNTPEQPQFSVDYSGAGLVIAVSPPQFPHRCKYYDIYVREQSFSEIGLFWYPDAKDKIFLDEYTTVFTHSGGTDSGGGELVKDRHYYVTVIGKDGTGFKNVNESNVRKIESILLN